MDLGEFSVGDIISGFLKCLPQWLWRRSVEHQCTLYSSGRTGQPGVGSVSLLFIGPKLLIHRDIPESTCFVDYPEW
jgi:hypothetical protein